MPSENKSDKDSLHKLAPISLGTYLVKQVEDKAKTAVIVYDNDTVENVSRSRIVCALNQLSSAELKSIVQPTILNQTIANYPATKAVKLKHVLSKDDNNANQETISERGARDHTQSCLLYTSPSPRDQRGSRMPSSA